MKETEQLICICSGLWMEAYSTKTTLSPGMLLEWKVQAINRGTVPVILKSIRVQQFDSTMNVTLRNNELLTLQRKQLLDPNTPVTQPYWLQQPTHLVNTGFRNVHWF